MIIDLHWKNDATNFFISNYLFQLHLNKQI